VECSPLIAPFIDNLAHRQPGDRKGRHYIYRAKQP
jgi:hypothetical protein